MGHWRHGPVQQVHAVRLHGLEVKHLGAAVQRPAPGGAREELDAANQGRQARAHTGAGTGEGVALVLAQPQVRVELPGPGAQAVEEVEAVGADPADEAGRDAVDSGVVLGAGEGGGVDLDGDDEVPVAGAGEGDGVAAGAGEEVDDDAGRGRVVRLVALAVEGLLVELVGYGAVGLGGGKVSWVCRLVGGGRREEGGGQEGVLGVSMRDENENENEKWV